MMSCKIITKLKIKKKNPVVNEIREMKSEIVAVIRGSVGNKSSSSISEVKVCQKANRLKPKGGQSRRLMREFGCESCRSKGKVVNVITASSVEVQNTTKQDVKSVW